MNNYPDDLTHREQEVLAFIAEGLSNRAIGARLNTSEKTVEGQVSSILNKLRLRNRVQAANWFWHNSTGKNSQQK